MRNIHQESSRGEVATYQHLMVKPLDPEEGTPGRSIGLAESEPLDVPEGRGYINRMTGCVTSKTTAGKKKAGFHRDFLGNLADSGFLWWEAWLRGANLDPKSHDAPGMDSKNFWFHFTNYHCDNGRGGGSQGRWPFPTASYAPTM